MFSFIVKILFIRNQNVCDSFLGLVELDNNGTSAAGIYDVSKGYLDPIKWLDFFHLTKINSTFE